MQPEFQSCISYNKIRVAPQTSNSMQFEFQSYVSYNKMRAASQTSNSMHLEFQSRVPINKGELRLNIKLSTIWVFYSWSYPNKTTKDCISASSQGLRLWNLNSSRQPKVRLILKDKDKNLASFIGWMNTNTPLFDKWSIIKNAKNEMEKS